MFKNPNYIFVSDTDQEMPDLDLSTAEEEQPGELFHTIYFFFYFSLSFSYSMSMISS